MQTVYDVLENQARSALLPDAIISTILSQLQVKVTYEPLNCENLLLTLADQAQLDANKGYCIIADNIVTGICTVTANMMCTPPNPAVTITSVPVNHTLISGTLMVGTDFFLVQNHFTSKKLCRLQTLLWRIGRERCGKMW
ncbi:hypothetical protein KIN20_014158 [Parelaphostrongylus tenuis]|uniref:Uncharacterized protein n=1 Tax=Parelaphostrongylus tenuis TaxID=148309 RepID=A0AAD5MVJ4_PARTN|nr:hypothetical protein KIN20_014158 [Parelaphostrongylus tenuis]